MAGSDYLADWWNLKEGLAELKFDTSFILSQIFLKEGEDLENERLTVQNKKENKNLRNWNKIRNKQSKKQKTNRTYDGPDSPILHKSNSFTQPEIQFTELRIHFSHNSELYFFKFSFFFFFWSLYLLLSEVNSLTRTVFQNITD